MKQWHVYSKLTFSKSRDDHIQTSDLSNPAHPSPLAHFLAFVARALLSKIVCKFLWLTGMFFVWASVVMDV